MAKVSPHMIPRARARLRGVQCGIAIAVTVTAIALAASSAQAQQTISTTSPITQIDLGSDLHCQAAYLGVTQFFGGPGPAGACGTFLSVDGVTYGPTVPAGPAPPAYTPLSQTTLGGAGTGTNPYSVTTTVQAGTSGLAVAQKDSYVNGESHYTTDIVVRNTGVKKTATVYHAGDCYLDGNDDGFGLLAATPHGIFCTKNKNNSPGAPLMGFIPTTGGFHYIEGFYWTVWSGITASGTPFNDTWAPSPSLDNGAGVSWTFTVPKNGSRTFSLRTVFSRDGKVSAPCPPGVEPHAEVITSVHDGGLVPNVAPDDWPDYAVRVPLRGGCVRRGRPFRLRLISRPNARIRQATVRLNGRRIATRRGSNVTDPVVVSHLPAGRRITLGVVLNLGKGKVIRGTRVFRMCTR